MPILKISILAAYMVPKLQKIFLQSIYKPIITMQKIEYCKLSFEEISKFSFTENFWSETKIRKFPHCVSIISTLCTAFWYKFRETNVFTKEVSIVDRELISRKLSLTIRNFFTFLPEISWNWMIRRKIYSHQKNNSSNQLIFCKNVGFTEFLP